MVVTKGLVSSIFEHCRFFVVVHRGGMLLEYMPRTCSQKSRIVSRRIVRIYAIYYTLAQVRC